MTNPFAEPTWAIVELFGRNVIAGEVSEVDIAGTQMLRVDVPSIEGMCGAPDVPAFTKFFGGEAIYAITPTDETTARHAVESMKVRPVQVWTVPDRVRRLPVGVDEFELEVDEEGVPL